MKFYPFNLIFSCCLFLRFYIRFVTHPKVTVNCVRFFKSHQYNLKRVNLMCWKFHSKAVKRKFVPDVGDSDVKEFVKDVNKFSI